MFGEPDHWPVRGLTWATSGSWAGVWRRLSYITILLELEQYSTRLWGHLSVFFTFSHTCTLKSKAFFPIYYSSRVFFFLPTKHMNRNVIRDTPCCLISLWVFWGFHLSTDPISLVSCASPSFFYKSFLTFNFERICLYIPESEMVGYLPTLLVERQVSTPAGVTVQRMTWKVKW